MTDNELPIQTVVVSTESRHSDRSHLALRPAPARTESQRDASREAYLADQKAQQQMARGGRDYHNIDEAYDLGVGVQSTWYEPGASTTVNVRQLDPEFKSKLDYMKDNGLISEQAYRNEINSALGKDIFVEAPPEADVQPLLFDQATSDNAHWVQGQVGRARFNTALSSYMMGDSTTAMNIADDLKQHGVTPNDMTGLYDSMANQAVNKIAEVMEANGDTDVDVFELAQWAKGLERSQQRELATTVLASAMYNDFTHVPELVQAFRLAKRK